MSEKTCHATMNVYGYFSVDIDANAFVDLHKKIKNIFSTWCSIQKLSFSSFSFEEDGICAEFSEEMEPSSEDINPLLEVDFLNHFELLKVNKQFTSVKNPKELFVSILDTDENKKIRGNTVFKAFPNVSFLEYKAEYHNSVRVLSFRVFIPYEDIFNLLKMSEMKR